MPIPYIPTAGYLLCEPLEDNETSSGVIIPEGGFDQLSKVLKVGDPNYLPNTEILLSSPAEKGDTILHSSVGFENFRHKGKKYRMVKFSNVLGVKNG